MENNKVQDHPLYKKAKSKFYFDRWKWIIWNGVISLLLCLRLRESYDQFDFILFVLTAVTTIVLLSARPKTKFEDSKECKDVKKEIY